MKKAKVLTRHAEQRMYQRLGVAENPNFLIQTVRAKGTTRKCLTGQLRKIVDETWHRHGCRGQYYVYEDYLWIFEGFKLITVYEIGDKI